MASAVPLSSAGVPATGSSAAPGGGGGSSVECRLDSAHDLAALLAALQLKEKDQRDQRVQCEASAKGLKFVAQSGAKDVVVLGWMLTTSFREYRFFGPGEEVLLKIPVAPLLNCLQIFTERASLFMRYPCGPSGEMYFTLEEDNAVTECKLRTFMLDEAPAAFGGFFAPGEPASVLRPMHPEAWYHALLEFVDIDAPDVALRVSLRATGSASEAGAAAVVVRAQTLTSDAEVELPRGVFETFELSAETLAAGEVTHCYPLTSVLASCLRAAKDAKGVKLRFNRDGVMSNQFILRGRGQADLFCEALVSPLVDFAGAPGATAAATAGADAGIAATAASSAAGGRWRGGSGGLGLSDSAGV